MKLYVKVCIVLSVIAICTGFAITAGSAERIKASDIDPGEKTAYVKTDLYEQVVADMTMRSVINSAVKDKIEVKPCAQRGFVKLDIPDIYVPDAVVAYYEEELEDENSLIIPCDNVTSLFGYQNWRHGTHKGIDIGRPQGSAICAAASGTVKKVVTGCLHNYKKSSSCGCGGGYGNYVVIDHGDGLETLYGHCQAIYVTEGQEIKKNSQIAEVGSTGWSTGWHLHFEVHENGKAMDPFSYQ